MVLGYKANYLVAESLHLKLFWDKMIPYRPESVHFFVLMNSATKTRNRRLGLPVVSSTLIHFFIVVRYP